MQRIYLIDKFKVIAFIECKKSEILCKKSGIFH